MSNVFTTYLGYVQEGQLFQQVAAALGKTPNQLIDEEFDIFSLLLSVEDLAPGKIRGTFMAGITMDVTYDPATLTVSDVATFWNGQPVVKWSGAMTAEQFLADIWPESIVRGSAYADFVCISNGTVYAGAGNDIIEVGDGARVYGQAGQDAFLLNNWYGNVTIADYQVGEKIHFDQYDSFSSLAAGFQGVSNQTAGGFTLNFGGQYGPQFSLTIQGTPLEQMRLEDLLVGVAGEQQIYAPIHAAYGIA